MKKRCEITLVIFELGVHEFVSLFSGKRVDELKNKLRAIQKGSKFELGSSFGGSMHENNVLVTLKKGMLLIATSPKLVQNFNRLPKVDIFS